jgi:DNA-binding ferritin-like protein
MKFKERMNMYFKLLVLLSMIKAYAKNIHYESKGIAFYGKHELADRIIGDNEEHIDSINEILYMGVQKEPPLKEDVWQMVCDNIPQTTRNDQENYANLYNILIETCNHLNFICNQEEISAAAGDLCGRIASDTQQMAGLVWRQIYIYLKENDIVVPIYEEGKEWQNIE